MAKASNRLRPTWPRIYQPRPTVRQNGLGPRWLRRWGTTEDLPAGHPADHRTITGVDATGVLTAAPDNPARRLPTAPHAVPGPRMPIAVGLMPGAAGTTARLDPARPTEEAVMGAGQNWLTALAITATVQASPAAGATITTGRPSPADTVVTGTGQDSLAGRAVMDTGRALQVGWTFMGTTGTAMASRATAGITIMVRALPAGTATIDTDTISQTGRAAMVTMGIETITSPVGAATIDTDTISQTGRAAMVIMGIETIISPVGAATTVTGTLDRGATIGTTISGLTDNNSPIIRRNVAGTLCLPSAAREASATALPKAAALVRGFPL